MGSLVHPIRAAPRADRFPVLGFHSVEFWCGDAAAVWRRFSLGLGLPLVAQSDQTTGNSAYASYVLRSDDLVFAFTAPYARVALGAAPPPHPGYDQAEASRFASAHALAVRAVALRVGDARAAHEAAVAHGGDSVLEPVELAPDFVMCELRLYGDVVLRLLSYSDGCDTPFLPGYAHASSSPPPAPAGLRRLDHVVGNVPCLSDAVEYLSSLSGFHEFAEFAAADVGTSESGLNSVVLASADERVLLPINEPVLGTKRRSQIQTFLEQHPGPGVQHLAIASDDIFASVAAMRAAPCGFEFLRAAGDAYYAAAPERVGAHVLSEAQWAACRREGVLIDRDDRGVLLQLFTRPVGDRATLFLEVIQRIGCEGEGPGGVGQAGGCGGFGKGNFAALFKSVEDEERLRTL